MKKPLHQLIGDADNRKAPLIYKHVVLSELLGGNLAGLREFSCSGDSRVHENDQTKVNCQITHNSQGDASVLDGNNLASTDNLYLLQKVWNT